MSTTVQQGLDLEETLARIQRMRAESDKFAAEQRKLISESDKFAAEQRKLISEASKFDRERYSLVIALLAALASAGTVLVAFITHR